jgi:hypothetical protein
VEAGQRPSSLAARYPGSPCVAAAKVETGICRQQWSQDGAVSAWGCAAHSLRCAIKRRLGRAAGLHAPPLLHPGRRQRPRLRASVLGRQLARARQRPPHGTCSGAGTAARRAACASACMRGWALLGPAGPRSRRCPRCVLPCCPRLFESCIMHEWQVVPSSTAACQMHAVLMTYVLG